MRVLLLLLALPILLFFCILTAYTVPLPSSLSGSRDLFAATAAGLAGAGYLLGLVLYLLWSLRRAGRAFDPILQPLGLMGKGYAVFGRRYSGVLEGRVVEVRYLPPHALRAAQLDLTVAAELGTRMALGRQRPLLDCRDCPRVVVGEDVPYTVYTQDAEAARHLLAQPMARAALDGLLDREETSSLYVQPNRLWYRARRWRIVEGEIEGQLEALVALANL